MENFAHDQVKVDTLESEILERLFETLANALVVLARPRGRMASLVSFARDGTVRLSAPFGGGPRVLSGFLDSVARLLFVTVVLRGVLRSE